MSTSVDHWMPRHSHQPRQISPLDRIFTPPSPNQTCTNTQHSFAVPIHLIHEESPKDDIKLFGFFSLSGYSRPVQFLCCGGGVCLFYVLQSIAKEYLFLTYKSEISFSCFLAMMQCFGYSAFAAMQILLIKDKSKVLQPQQSTFGSIRFMILMIVIGLLGDVSMAFSNTSLNFLPFPTLVMVKSCKVLVAMVLSVSLYHLQRLYFQYYASRQQARVFENPKYNNLDYFAAMVLMLGLVVLAVANQKDVSFIFQSMDWRGLVLALLAVVADAMVSLIQEICMKKDDHAQYQKEEPVTVIFYSYGFGFVVLLLYSTILSDEFWTVSKFAYSNPKFIGILFGFIVLGHLGVNCTLALLKEFGAFISLTTASCRKAVTIVLSFLIFAKPMSTAYQLAILLVFTGIVINVYNKNVKHR